MGPEPEPHLDQLEPGATKKSVSITDCIAKSTVTFHFPALCRAKYFPGFPANFFIFIYLSSFHVCRQCSPVQIKFVSFAEEINIWYCLFSPYFKCRLQLLPFFDKKNFLGRLVFPQPKGLNFYYFVFIIFFKQNLRSVLFQERKNV